MFISSAWAKNSPGYRFIRKPHFPFWTFSYFIKGKIRVSSREETKTLDAPCLALVEANTSYHHEVIVSSREVFAYFVPRSEMEPFLDWPRFHKGMRILHYADSRFSKQIEQAVLDMLDFSESSHPDRCILAENALERALLLAHLINPNQRHARLDERIRSITEYIDANFSLRLTVESLAQRTHLSPSHFAHLFRREMGKGVMEYLEERRIQEAQKLLVATNRTAAEISDACGFSNQYHFSTRFKKLVGKPPREYRLNPSTVSELGKGEIIHPKKSSQRKLL